MDSAAPGGHILNLEFSWDGFGNGMRDCLMNIENKSSVFCGKVCY